VNAVSCVFEAGVDRLGIRVSAWCPLFWCARLSRAVLPSPNKLRQLHSEVPEMTSGGSDYVWDSQMVLKHANAMFQTNRSQQVTAAASWLCVDDNGIRYVPLSYSAVCLVEPRSSTLLLSLSLGPWAPFISLCHHQLNLSRFSLYCWSTHLSHSMASGTPYHQA